MSPLELLVLLLSCAYATTGFVFAAMYLPKLRRMLRDPAATAASHSPSSELLWTSCRLISLLYVSLVAAQPLIALVVMLDLLGRIASTTIVLSARRAARGRAAA